MIGYFKGLAAATVIVGLAMTGATAFGTQAASAESVVGTSVAAGDVQNDTFDTLLQAAHVDRLMQVIATEGARHGVELEASLFPGRGGAGWRRAVSAIQGPERLASIVGDALRRDLAPDDATAATAFLDSDLGRRIVAREVDARQSMLIDADSGPVSADAGRGALIAEMIERLDLIEANVSGGLNANLAFYRGLSDGGALKKRLTEREMIAMVWQQEGQMRETASVWLQDYLNRAYAPLSDDDLRGYLAFAETVPGRRYSAALLSGFGAVFERTSYDLGRAAALYMTQQQL